MKTITRKTVLVSVFMGLTILLFSMISMPTMLSQPVPYYVYGTVYNSTGAPVPSGVTVYITDTNTSKCVKSVETDGAGSYGYYQQDIGYTPDAIGHLFVVNATYQGESGNCSFVYDPVGNYSQQCDIYLKAPYGVNLTVEGAKTAAKTTTPNVNATYTLTVKNTGNQPDNYTLSVDNADNAAVANLSIYSITNLAPGATQTVLLNVTDESLGIYSVDVAVR